VETENSYYDIKETPIEDKSVLGTHGQKLCDNLDVYWMIETVQRKYCKLISLGVVLLCLDDT